MDRFYKVSLICLVWIVLNGCGPSAQRAAKYDSTNSVDPNKAIVIVGTKNVGYFDLHRYGATVPQTSVDTIAKPELKVAGANTCDVANPEQARKNVVSADPMQQDYTNSSFNLRWLFDHNSPSNLGEAIEKNEQYGSKPGSKSGEKSQMQQPCDNNSKLNVNKAVNTNLATEYRIHKPTFLFSVFNYSKATYTIEPGIYYISFAYYEKNSDVHFTRLSGLTKNGVVQYGAFEVQPGDVVYLGDVDFNWVNIDKPNMVSIVNNFNEVKKDLISSNNRELALKVTQARFYPAGSRIEIDPEGRTSIVR
jgi:hypothetical protein